MGERIFVDADVLFSRTLRDWLFLLRNETAGGMFTVGSTEDVLAEVISRYRDRHPSAPGGLMSRMRASLESNLDEVIDNYDVAPWMLEGDAGDGHVRAACVGGAFDMLLTADKVLLNDADAYPQVGYEPIHPDDFFVLADDSGRRHVRAVTKKQCDYFMNARGQADLTGALRNAGCPKFAERVNGHLHRLFGC